jgi:hypothetical protein
LKDVTAAIRPEEMLMSAAPSGLENEFAAQVASASFLGELTVCDLIVNGIKLKFKTTQSATVGNLAYVRLPKEKLKLFSR